MTPDIRRPPRIRPAWMSLAIEVAAGTVICAAAIIAAGVVLLGFFTLVHLFS